jgi:hypothetical protein
LFSRHKVQDPVRLNASFQGRSQPKVNEAELRCTVCVSAKGNATARFGGQSHEITAQVLTIWIAINLNRLI